MILYFGKAQLLGHVSGNCKTVRHETLLLSYRGIDSACIFAGATIFSL